MENYNNNGEKKKTLPSHLSDSMNEKKKINIICACCCCWVELIEKCGKGEEEEVNPLNALLSSEMMVEENFV